VLGVRSLRLEHELRELTNIGFDTRCPRCADAGPRATMRVRRAVSRAARRSMGTAGELDTWGALERDVVACSRCPRLVRWRATASARGPRAGREAQSWARPVPGFGDENARIVIFGLAPGALGANRTGRPFTGDASSQFLYAALHRAGLASAAVSLARDDGLKLRATRLTNVVRCVPPQNAPTRREFARCASFTRRELALASQVRVVVCLGAHAWREVLLTLQRMGHPSAGPTPRFAHGASVNCGPLLVLAAFHPSPLNTRTGRLTPAMFDLVLRRALEELR